MKNQIMQIKDVLSAFTPNEIAACLDNQIQSGCNKCIKEADNLAATNVLSKAQYIGDLIKQGYSMHDAIRKSGHQIRQLSIYSESRKPLPYKTLKTNLDLK